MTKEEETDMNFLAAKVMKEQGERIEKLEGIIKNTAHIFQKFQDERAYEYLINKIEELEIK